MKVDMKQRNWYVGLVLVLGSISSRSFVGRQSLDRSLAVANKPLAGRMDDRHGV